MADAPAGGTPHRHATLARVLWIIYWLGLTGLLLSPKLPRSPVEISEHGWVAHFISFSLLTGGVIIAHHAAGRRAGPAWYAAWLLVFAAYGGLIELIQPWVNRSCDFFDWLFDLSGVVAAVLAGALWRGYSAPRA